ncbi:sugar ABC transporter ATP-binding protein [Kineosporia sp. A_224]|uniref:sugar ABC transporter ATP-binding protein n=1 Tax=Kineosporia sp. A_224 TaxID=1962180 RepID=UPI000B4B512E|nr:sugar ABC transporter ATP-binding protein [Kineosporia sp. A_224]
MSALLEVQGLVKSFHGNRVVDDVSFTLEAGRIVALLGENGAGKSTLIKMLAGVYKKDGGRVLLEGQDLEDPGVRGRISFIHQDLGLVDWMTVGENMALSLGFPRRGGGSRGLVDWAAVDAQAAKALALVGGGIDPSTRMFDLPRTEKALVAIARALVTEPALLVLDEPTASLPAADVQRLFDVVRELAAGGVGMIYVSHRLDEVYDIADSVVVMRNGVKVGDAPVAEVPPARLVELIVGRSTRSVSPGEVGSTVRLELDGLVAGDVGPVDLTVRRGEVVGLVGLRGAGQTEVGRAIAGATSVTGGRMRLDGAAFAPRSTTDAVVDGVGFATSNRETEGIAAGLSVRENLFLNPGVWGRRLRSLSTQRAERVRARELVARFGVRPGDPEVAADTLSGGNQQKVVLARWFGVGRKVVVLEEPTMGVDVGAKADIYALLREAGEQGTAAVVVSTDVEEVAAICHRALVFGRGRVTAELAGDDLTVAGLVAAASGLPPAPLPVPTEPTTGTTNSTTDEEVRS